MKSERGAAIVLVLLILGILTLLGAGLMVQTRYDVKFNRAQGSYDKMLNLADGAAKVSLFGISYQVPGAYSGEGVQVPIDPETAGDWKTQGTVGTWQSQAWYMGATLHPQDMAGWEIGTGYYGQLWVGQGAGTKVGADFKGLGADSALSTIQVAGVKFSK
jgi:hypothetical protein